MGASQSPEWQGYDHQLFQDTEVQSIQIPDTAKEGCSPIIRHPTCEKGFAGFLTISDGKEKLDTAWKLWEQTITEHGSKPFVGFRPFTDAENPKKRGDYKWMTYAEFNDYVLSYGNGLRSLGVEDKSQIGLFSINRPEWYAVHCANLSQSYRTVALYDTLGPDAVSYIIRHAECPAVFCEKNKLKYLFEAVEKGKAEENEDTEREDEENKEEDENVLKLALKYVIQIDYNEVYGNKHETVSEDDKKTAEDLGLTLLSLSELYEKGKGNTTTVPPSADDIAYIMYTSGTTGNPKGVLLPHKAFAAMVATAARFINVTPEDVHVSYLPLAHIFEAATQQVMASGGARVAYYQGDLRLISKDWLDVRPTILIGVPRVFNKTYDKYKMKTAKFGALKRWFVGAAEKSSAEKIRDGKRSSFYDKMVWNDVAPGIGFDRVRLVVSGAAPLPPHIAEFMRIIIPKASIIQGYGMTENCAGCTITGLQDYTLGHVGIPIDNAEVRLVNAPECGYLVTDKPYARGEIQSRGLTTMAGYFKNSKKTSETINEEGWLSTGDIGRLNPNGTISIIDRRKNMFKTAMGEYVASEKVEQVYCRATSVGQMFLYGNGFKSFVVAVVVPDAQVLEELFRDRGDWKEDVQAGTQEYADKFVEIAGKNLDVVKEFVMKEMKEQEGELKKFERIKDIYIEHRIDMLMQGFTVENNLMTPTFKLKRPQLTRAYIEQIKELYSKNGEPPNENEAWIS